MDIDGRNEALEAATSAGACCVAPLGLALGEGALWLDRDALGGPAFWCVDILGRRIWRFDPAITTALSWSAPSMPGFIAPLPDGRFIAGLADGLHRFDPADGSFDFLCEVEPDRPGNRVNDGYVDHEGRLWFGTMNLAETEPTGALYEVDGLLGDAPHVRRVDDGYVVTNGPAAPRAECGPYGRRSRPPARHARPMRVMLFHGWGFDASVWDAVVACLPADCRVGRAERGYFGADPAEIWPDGPRAGTVAVGHSMGVLHALRAAAGEPPGALLSINGFARFCAGAGFGAGVPPRLPARMLARMETTPDEVVAAFRAMQGAPRGADTVAFGSRTEPARLAADLRWLIEADLRDGWTHHPGPKAALAGSDDLLVGAGHARACFGDRTSFHPGAHLLPLTAPQACADAIVALGRALGAAA